jgi:hypothetical protein
MTTIHVLAIIAGSLPILAGFVALAVIMWRDVGPGAVFTWLGLYATALFASCLLVYGITGISQ